MPTASMNAMSAKSESRLASLSITLPPTFTSTVDPQKSCMYGRASVKTAALCIAKSNFSIECQLYHIMRMEKRRNRQCPAEPK